MSTQSHIPHNFNPENSLLLVSKKDFLSLVEMAVEKVLANQRQEKKRWISDKEAMTLLGITSKTTLQRFRNEGLITFSAITKKNILYCRQSILNFIESKISQAF